MLEYQRGLPKSISILRAKLLPKGDSMETRFHQNLSKKLGKGVAWNIFSQVLQQAIRLCVIFILARLLNPADFGIFAMAMVFIEFIEPFREWGFQAALIYKQDIDEEYKSTAFWSICVVAVSLYLSALILASSIGRFFNNSEVSKIIPFVALGILFAPLGAVQWAMLVRDLKFNAIAGRNAVAEVLYGTTACVLAFNNFGVWSFVIGSIVRELTWSLALWIFYKWRPLFKFSITKFKEILGYSVNCTGISVLNSGINNVDNLLVGKFLGTIKLGFYNLAFNTVSHPQTKLASQISIVTFPAFSIIQNNKERILSAYEKTLRAIMLVTVPPLAILFTSAKEFISVFYGNKWLESVFLIQIMCFYGLLRAIASASGSVFLSKGRAALYLKINILKLAIFLVALLYGLRYGIIGVAFAVLAYSVITFLPVFYYTNKTLGANNLRLYTAVFQYIVVYFSIIGIVWYCDRVILQCYEPMPILHLGINIVLGISVYFAILVMFLRSDLHLMFDLVKKLLKK